jgi:hypothetical protein
MIIALSFVLYAFSPSQMKYSLISIRLITNLYKLELKELKTVLERLKRALLLLAETFALFGFFILLYGIVGLQLFSDALHHGCLLPKSGKPFVPYIWCGNVDCPEGGLCADIVLSAHQRMNILNFDDIFHSMLMVFRVLTLDDWSKLQYQAQRTFSNYSWIYFVSLIFIGNFFLLNLTLAVLKVKFSSDESEGEYPAVASGD